MTNSTEVPVYLNETEEDLASALELISDEVGQATSGKAAISRAVAVRIAVDPMYTWHIIEQRNSPEQLDEIIARGERQGVPAWAPLITAKLALKAARGLAKWAAYGFGEVSEEVLNKRRAACLACPNLRELRDHGLLRSAIGGPNEICGLCSCAVEHKIRMPTETCPDPDKDNPDFNRWGEEIF